jgi:Lhr-like helicase
MLRGVRTVIVDEIHAVIGTRRGSHLALTLERLESVCAESERVAAEAPGAKVRPRLQRIGLSATQKPIDEVARFLVGNDDTRGDCVVIDEGHRRAMDLSIEVPPSPLTAVMAMGVSWRFCWRNCAVTTISSSPVWGSCACACAAACMTKSNAVGTKMCLELSGFTDFLPFACCYRGNGLSPRSI